MHLLRTSLLGALVTLAACSSSDTRTLTGRVGPMPGGAATGVKVLQGTTVVASAAVAADGTFRVDVPVGVQVSLRLVGTGHDNVVFPRKSGTVQGSFRLAAGGTFDLGKLHWVGNSAATTFSFGHGSDHEGCDDDGHDQMGATCVDDEGDDEGGTCGSGSGSGAGSGSGSGSGSGVGVLPRDGSGDGSGSGMDDDGHDDGDCVGDHDVPDDSCEGEDDGSGDDHDS